MPGWAPRRRRGSSPKRKNSGKATDSLDDLRKKVQKNLGLLKAPDGKSAATGMEVEARLDALVNPD